ncbi:MAG: mercury transporter MerT [Pseudorhodoplanes sp.]|nr:mercury transporter MerT [Pseudorhodoplanes sp.]
MSDRPQAATLAAKHVPAAEFGENAHRKRGPAWLAAGSLVGALAASACCILPVALFGLGIGGAWIANFTQLAPYKPYFIVATLALLCAGYWLVHRASKAACANGEACSRPLPNRIVKIVLATATALVIAAFAFDYVAPYLL